MNVVEAPWQPLTVLIFHSSIYIQFSRILRLTTFAVWSWLKMSWHAVSHLKESFQHQTVINIWTSLISLVTITTCWTHGSIATVKSVRMELPYWDRCAGNECISKCHRQQYKRYVDKECYTSGYAQPDQGGELSVILCAFRFSCKLILNFYYSPLPTPQNSSVFLHSLKLRTFAALSN